MIEGAAKPPKYSCRTTRETCEQIFGHALVQAVSSAIDIAGCAEPLEGRKGKRSTPAQRARDWFISSYPLLGALAATFELIEDPTISGRLQI